MKIKTINSKPALKGAGFDFPLFFSIIEAMPEKNKKRKIYKKRKIFKTFLKLAALCLFLLVFIPSILFLYFIKDLPRPEKFAEGIFPQSTKIYDRTGQALIYEISGEEKRTLISLEEVPVFVIQALVATEDKKFYKHQGVDFKGIARAILYDLKLQQPVQGASTISQQLIRSYFLSQHKTLKRKTRELILTLELERRYDKEQILEWYLNLVPFGSNIYGVQAASEAFFEKKASELSLAEACVLVALIKAPTRLSPYGENKEALLQRKDFVLDNMLEMDFLSKEEAQQAKQEELSFSEGTDTFPAPHFVIYVLDYLETKYGREYLERAGLEVITTLDLTLQERAERVVKEGVEAARYANAHNGALVALNPKTGEVLAMAGSRDYFGKSFPEDCVPGKDCLFDPQVNVAISLRQPGSSFKPFVYALSFYKGFTPQAHIWDVKTEFNYLCSPAADQERDKYNSKCYHPQNYDGTFKGQTSFKNALAQSRNVPSVKVLYLAGLTDTLDFAKKFGIQTFKDASHYGLALVLGGGEVKLLEMALGYSVFANDGVKNNLNVVKEIRGQKGKIIERMKTESLKVIPSETARQINDILSDNEARAPVFGWNSVLYLKDYEAAVKTGTTQEYKDAWTIGYTPNLAVGVWVGNNDNTPTTRAGVYLAGPIWNRFMRETLNDLPKENFPKPKKTQTGNPILDGAFLGEHSILFYLNKDNPRIEGNSRNDPQAPNWDYAVQAWLNSH